MTTTLDALNVLDEYNLSGIKLLLDEYSNIDYSSRDSLTIAEWVRTAHEEEKLRRGDIIRLGQAVALAYKAAKGTIPEKKNKHKDFPNTYVYRPDEFPILETCFRQIIKKNN